MLQHEHALEAGRNRVLHELYVSARLMLAGCDPLPRIKRETTLLIAGVRSSKQNSPSF